MVHMNVCGHGDQRLRSKEGCGTVFFLMIRRPPRSTQSRSSAASDVYKRQVGGGEAHRAGFAGSVECGFGQVEAVDRGTRGTDLSLIHISEPTRPY